MWAREMGKEEVAGKEGKVRRRYAKGELDECEQGKAALRKNYHLELYKKI